MGPEKWGLLLVIILIVLIGGGSILPKLGHFFGKSVTGVKEGLKEGAEQFKAGLNEDESKPAKKGGDSDTYDPSADG
jgi:Sec-independent protein translocase protein TatA